MLEAAEERKITDEVEQGVEVEDDRDHQLLAHFWSLHAAVIKRDGLEDRMRAGTHEAEMLVRSLAAAEGVLQARSALYRHLIGNGWTPPPALVRDLVYDEIVLAETEGAALG